MLGITEAMSPSGTFVSDLQISYHPCKFLRVLSKSLRAHRRGMRLRFVPNIRLLPAEPRLRDLLYMADLSARALDPVRGTSALLLSQQYAMMQHDNTLNLTLVELRPDRLPLPPQGVASHRSSI